MLTVLWKIRHAATVASAHILVFAAAALYDESAMWS